MFTQQTLDFMFENRINNSKIWFEEHRGDYEKHLLHPFQALVENIAPYMLDIDPEMVTEPKVTRTISRIHRDTRFSKDKSKYRDSMWLFFRRDKKLYPNYPSFFFELRPAYAWWGCGMYMADSSYLESYRSLILNGNKSFKEAQRALKKQDRFTFDTDGAYKRSKYPDMSAELRIWLDRKSVYMMHTEEDPSTCFGDGLPDRLIADFQLLAPLYQFLISVCEHRITPERTYDIHR